MKRYLQYFLFVLIADGICCSGDVRAQTDVPEATHVIMPNGFFAEGEWDDASKVDVEDGIKVYAKQDERHLYVAICAQDTAHTGLDLYIATNAESQLLFHVSSAFASATCENGEWSEWRWEQNRRWTANKIGLYHDGDKRCSSEPEGFEFQISKDMIHGEVVYVAFRLKRPPYEYPSEEDREAFNNWIPFRIGK